MEKDPKACAVLAAKTLDDKKGRDIVILDISDISSIADYFVIATGRSIIHVKALADEVEKKLMEEGYKLRGKEGYEEAKWVLLDFNDVVIHIFYEPEREYYMLERLWADARRLDIDITCQISYNK
ncbi:ribosome silencing factor [Thermoanaerobacterium sp. DL9XJH110]|uniref:ribosome silencing factor n=1 Tax=Thermoanaerobacterium sp. DL9XJH110 TaxID=3386643 RepID=UPI003BB7CF6F